MQDEHSNTGQGPHTQWSDEDRALLKKLATGHPSKATLLEAFPGRTLGSIRQKLFITRRALGIGKKTEHLTPFPVEPTMLDPDDPGLLAQCWQQAQRPALVQASRSYLEALRRAA